MIIAVVVLPRRRSRSSRSARRRCSARTSCRRAREFIVRTILRLPLGAVESASTGDLVTRVTRDVGTMSRSVQYGVPMAIISLLTVVLSIGAMLLNSVVLAVPALLTFATSGLGGAHATCGARPRRYITEGATYSRINTTLTETVEGARTLESLGLSGVRVRAGDADIEVSAQAERYTMSLRNILFAALNFAFQTPRVITLLVGAYAYSRGWVDLGQITAAVLYVEALADPLDRLIGEIDRLQVGAASTSRLLGIAEVRPDRTAGDRLPDGTDLVGEDLRFAYREGHDVLHGVDLRLGAGERLAIVGPSGSGKSTLGRLLSGINRPRTGSASVGGVELVDLPLEVLRTEVALVTQEHHVFIGSVRDNIVLAREGSDDDAVREALSAVGSLLWVERLPQGLDTMIGSGRYALTPAQAQQVALARLIIADPHTLVLDEATSLIDPRTARTLEGSMNNLLAGPHGRRDRPPPAHRPRRRPHRGGHRRAHRRARQPPRARRPGRRVRRAVARLDLLTRVRRNGCPGVWRRSATPSTRTRARRSTSAVRASPRVLVATNGVSATAATALKLSVRKVAHDITAPRRVGTRSRVISWIDG